MMGIFPEQFADIEAIVGMLGDKPWLVGDQPCGADATVWSFVAGTLCPYFASPIRDHGEKLPRLVAYRDRGLMRWYPELAAQVGTASA